MKITASLTSSAGLRVTVADAFLILSRRGSSNQLSANKEESNVETTDGKTL